MRWGYEEDCGGEVMPSKALKKLRKEVEVKEEWVFRIFDKPPGLTVDHRGDIHQLAVKELRDLMRGYLKGEYYMDVVYDPEEGAYIHVLTMINLARYPWLPKYLYTKFLRCVCEVLGIPYRPQMMDAIMPRHLTPKARVVFPEKLEKKLWDEGLGRCEELKEELDRDKEYIEGLIKFFKEVKEG